MARKKWVIDERTPRTPEERKWVEEQLNRERTPEELKRAILGLPCYKPAGRANWMMWFNKKINARLPTCVDEPEIFYKEVEEEGEYADSHFSEIKRGIIDIIKQNPQEWEIKEENVSHVELEGLPKSEWKSKEMAVRKKGIMGDKSHFKNGFTEEEWKEIENALNYSNFQDLSWEELTKEIEIQKAEIEKIKNNKDISNSERQIELQKREEKLKKLEKIRSNTTQKPKPNNNFPTGWVIGSGALAVVGIIGLLIIKKSKKKKNY